MLEAFVYTVWEVINFNIADLISLYLENGFQMAFRAFRHSLKS